MLQRYDFFSRCASETLEQCDERDEKAQNIEQCMMDCEIFFMSLYPIMLKQTFL